MQWHESSCNLCNNDDACNSVLNRLFNMNEVEAGIKELPSGKSPGIDGILNKIIKNAKLILVPLLTRLFNTILETGQYPRDWCSAKIVPIKMVMSMIP